MEIVIKTIRIIDYENNAVYVRETPETFSEYVSQLITYIMVILLFVNIKLVQLILKS